MGPLASLGLSFGLGFTDAGSAVSGGSTVVSGINSPELFNLIQGPSSIPFAEWGDTRQSVPGVPRVAVGGSSDMGTWLVIGLIAVGGLVLLKKAKG